MENEKRKEFEQAAEALRDWIIKYGDPYTIVVVQEEGAKVLQTDMYTPFDVPD